MCIKEGILTDFSRGGLLTSDFGEGGARLPLGLVTQRVLWLRCRLWDPFFSFPSFRVAYNLELSTVLWREKLIRARNRDWLCDLGWAPSLLWATIASYATRGVGWLSCSKAMTGKLQPIFAFSLTLFSHWVSPIKTALADNMAQLIEYCTKPSVQSPALHKLGI